MYALTDGEISSEKGMEIRIQSFLAVDMAKHALMDVFHPHDGKVCPCINNS